MSKNISSSSPSDLSYVADITFVVSALKNTVFLPGSERCSARAEWCCTWNTDSLSALHADARRGIGTKQAAEEEASCPHTVGTHHEFLPLDCSPTGNNILSCKSVLVILGCLTYTGSRFT